MPSVTDPHGGTVSSNNVFGVERSGQLELFGGEAVAYSGPDPDQMRAWLQGVLAEAQAAETAPWPPGQGPPLSPDVPAAFVLVARGRRRATPPGVRDRAGTSGGGLSTAPARLVCKVCTTAAGLAAA